MRGCFIIVHNVKHVLCWYYIYPSRTCRWDKFPSQSLGYDELGKNHYFMLGYIHYFPVNWRLWRWVVLYAWSCNICTNMITYINICYFFFFLSLSSKFTCILLCLCQTHSYMVMSCEGEIHVSDTSYCTECIQTFTACTGMTVRWHSG